MFLATDSTKNGRYEFGDDECSPCVLRSKVCSINLKVAHEGGVGNTTVSVAGVLFRDGTELGGGGVLLGKDGTGDGDDLLLAVLSVFEEGGAPRVASHAAAGDEYGGGGELAGEVVKEVVALQGAVEDEAGELDDLLVGVSRLEVSDEEGVSAGDGDLVLQSLENLLLHVDDLVAGVGTVADVDQIAQFRGVDLLVLGGDEKARHADELELGSFHLLSLEVSVDEVDREVERLRHELELEMDLNEPIDEDGAHPLVDVGLVLHVRRSDGSGVLLASKVEVLFCCVGLRIWEFGDDGEEWHIWVGERVCWRLKRYAKNMTMAQDVCWISLRSTAAVHACNRIVFTYHLLDVVGSAERVLPVPVVNVVNLPCVLVAGRIGNGEARRARGCAVGPLLLDRGALGVRIVPHLTGTGGGGHGTGGSLLDPSSGSSLAPLPGCVGIPSGVHIDARAELPAGSSGCASRSLTWLLEHDVLLTTLRICRQL